MRVWCLTLYKAEGLGVSGFTTNVNEIIMVDDTPFLEDGDGDQINGQAINIFIFQIHVMF